MWADIEAIPLGCADEIGSLSWPRLVRESRRCVESFASQRGAETQTSVLKLSNQLTQLR
jgi:hypothetical protein